MTQTKPQHPARVPAMDLADYREVLVVQTGDVGDHTYRRGQRVTVDTATLAELRARGMIHDDVKPAT